jgi:formylglycine-generating enzyme required for sulfatase activity
MTRRVCLVGSVLPLALALVGLTLLPAHSKAGEKPVKAPPKSVAIDLAGGLKMEFVLIPKGTFRMGSPADENGHDRYMERFDPEKQP